MIKGLCCDMRAGRGQAIITVSTVDNDVLYHVSMYG